MNLIKNGHKLEGILKPADIDKMEHAALEHKRYANITFKILDVDDKSVTIRVSQEKSAAENYQDQKRLAAIVQETFGRFFKDRKIHARAFPYKLPPSSKVDSKWILNQMNQTGIGLKQLEEDTGLLKSQLSAVINGVKPLSQPMKALFWFYFLAKQAA